MEGKIIDGGACPQLAMTQGGCVAGLHSRIAMPWWRLCHTGALGDERHMLLECPALADLRDSTLHWLQSAQVSWLGLCGPETSPWSAGTSLLASIECHADDRRTLFHPFSLVGCQG